MLIALTTQLTVLTNSCVSMVRNDKIRKCILSSGNCDALLALIDMATKHDMLNFNQIIKEAVIFGNLITIAQIWLQSKENQYEKSWMWLKQFMSNKENVKLEIRERFNESEFASMAVEAIEYDSDDVFHYILRFGIIDYDDYKMAALRRYREYIPPSVHTSSLLELLFFVQASKIFYRQSFGMSAFILGFGLNYNLQDCFDKSVYYNLDKNLVFFWDLVDKFDLKIEHFEWTINH
ncbi:hypothetical protein ROZALSC1DRAFT_29357, partial [Rozella allomycis CSF55]